MASILLCFSPGCSSIRGKMWLPSGILPGNGQSLDSRAIWNFQRPQFEKDEKIIENHIPWSLHISTNPAFLRLSEAGSSRWSLRWSNTQGLDHRFPSENRTTFLRSICVLVGQCWTHIPKLQPSEYQQISHILVAYIYICIILYVSLSFNSQASIKFPLYIDTYDT